MAAVKPQHGSNAEDHAPSNNDHWSEQRPLRGREISNPDFLSSERHFLDPNVEEEFHLYRFATQFTEIRDFVFSWFTIGFGVVFSSIVMLVHGFRIWTLFNILQYFVYIVIRQQFILSENQTLRRKGFEYGPSTISMLAFLTPLCWLASEIACVRFYEESTGKNDNETRGNDEACSESTCCIHSVVLGTGMPWELVNAAPNEYLFMVWAIALANLAAATIGTILHHTRPKYATRLSNFALIICIILAALTNSLFFACWAILGVLAFNANKDQALMSQYEKIERSNFIDSRTKDLMISMQLGQLSFAKAKVSKMQDALMAKQGLLTKVMNESRQFLVPFELAYADLEWGEHNGSKIQLGEGSFGTVFKAILRGEHEVAVKTLRVSKISKEVLLKFKSELIIMCPLRHLNLVRLWGGVWNEGADKLCIVLEFCTHGSMAAFLRKDSGTWEGVGYGLALGTAKCLSYLHHGLNEPLIHRDMKPDNILVGEGVVAKVADFGESRHYDSSAARRNSADGAEELSMTMVGTKLYCAPEITRGERYNESIDTYSFSLILLCLAIGNIDYIKEANRNVHSYVYGWRPPIPETFATEQLELVSLIQHMWQSKQMRSSSPMSHDLRGRVFIGCAGNFHFRPSMDVVVDTLCRLSPTENIKTSAATSSGAILNEDEVAGAVGRHQRSSRSYAVFLSHHKVACATEARLVKIQYELIIGAECFLDSDNLRDLSNIVDHVKDSDVLALFQSKEVLCRPWCLIELNTAIDFDIPIVALNCVGKGYDFIDAVDFMLHLETSLATHNPDALSVLKKNNVDPVRLAHKLWSVLPNIISIPLDTTASDNAIKAAMADFVKAVANAKPVLVDSDFDEWHQSRRAEEKDGVERLLDQCTIRGTQRGRMLQKIERAEELAEEVKNVREELKTERDQLRKERSKNENLVSKYEEILEKLTAKHEETIAKHETTVEKLMAKIERLEEKLGY